MGKRNHSYGSAPPTGWSPMEGYGGQWTPEMWHRRRRFVRRFFFFFLIFALVLVAVLAGLVLLIVRASGLTVGPGEALLAICGLPLVFVVVVALFGGMAFRRFGSPMADIMTAADAVAAGDLSVRVRENTPGEVGRLARRFNRMTAELARSEDGRRRLTADIAHELRTPLQIIQGNLEGVVDGVYEPDVDHISATLAETRRLARLVDDLQTLSLAESGHLPLHRQTLPAADLLADAVTRYAAAAADQQVSLETTPVDGSPVVNVDADRIAQVLSNLVANALRHTPPGGKVTLSASATPAGVRLAVADTGDGIDPADLPNVFDRFWRGDRARARRTDSGSGLGLAIARQLVQAHGGVITVDSTLGAGTTFTLELPS